VAPSSAEAASSDLVKLMAEVPAGIRAFLAGTAQLLTVVLPIAMVGFGIWHRRFRELLLVAASALVAWGAVALIESQFDKAEPTEALQNVKFESWLTDASFPGVVYLAALTAAITAASPLLDRPWRRTGWIAVGSAVVVRMLTATQAPVSLLVTVLVGAAAASLVLVVVGAPARRPGSEQLSEAARRAGMTLTDFQPVEVVGREGRWFRCRSEDGIPVVLKYVDGDERDADLLYRLWRAIRV
jgi:undecaprenyl-diphosphatase